MAEGQEDKDQRAAFEVWISLPPYERLVSRFKETDPSWPGSYRDIDVDLAWQAWKMAAIRALKNAAPQVAGEAQEETPKACAESAGAAPHSSVLVPAEPTDAMIEAGHEKLDFDDSFQPDAEPFNKRVCVRIYRAMLAAAPQAVAAPSTAGRIDAERQLTNIANAERFNREIFRDDTDFADWAQNICRDALARSSI